MTDHLNDDQLLAEILRLEAQLKALRNERNRRARARRKK